MTIYHNTKTAGHSLYSYLILRYNSEGMQYQMEEVIFRIIPENSGLFSGLIRKIVLYFPD